MLNILLRKMWCWTFYFVKCDALRCQNAFWHQMHFGIKCIFAQRCWTFSFGKCDAKMHFCTAEHFPLENVRWTFFFGKCTPKCILASNAFVTFCVTKCTHQMHFCIKCIFAQLNIFQRKMFSTNKMWCKNIFLQSIKCICNILFCWTFSFGKCSASNAERCKRETSTRPSTQHAWCVKD